MTNVFAVQLVVPDVYQLIKVNGESISSNFFSSETVVDLKIGRNTVILRYSELFEDDDNDDHETIKSAPQIVVFTIAKNEINKYSLISPEFDDDEQARLYAQLPKIKIVFTNTRSEKQNELELISKNLTEFSAEVAIHELEQLNIYTSVKPQHISGNLEPAVDINILGKLKHWWAKADEKQKKQFIDFTQQ